MPVVSELATAAHMSERQHAASFKPSQVHRVKVRVERTPVGAVAIQQQRVGAVEFESTPVDNRKRDERFLGWHFHFLRLDVFGVSKGAEVATWCPRRSGAIVMPISRKKLT